MVEKDIENKIKNILNQEHIYFVKIHGNSYQKPGVPDIIMNFYGEFWAIEVKKTPNKPTEIQKNHLRRCYGHGMIIDETNVDEFVEIIKNRGSNLGDEKTLFHFSKKSLRRYQVIE